MTTHTILFLAATPIGAPRLALGEEARAIQDELERADHRHRFELTTRWAARPGDLLRYLRRLRPTVVHFAGHGDEHGLYFQSNDGTAQIVSADAIARTFGVAGGSVQLVVLSACYSQPQGAALRGHVNCVVGVRGTIGDDAARAFAVGLYGALGDGLSIEAAYQHGCAAPDLEGFPDADHPRLEIRDGIDPATLILAEIAQIENLDVDRTAERGEAEPAILPVGYCPYPGLAYFGPGEADLFFGRKEAIDRLARAVDRQSLTVLVGGSGSGKSSVVLAGLAPRLHRTAGWRFSYFRIGLELDHDPFFALARALVAFRDRDLVDGDTIKHLDDAARLATIRACAGGLRDGSLSLRDVLADVHQRSGGARILLVADQFEEVFTLVTDEALARSFIDVLLAGFADPPAGTSPMVSLVVTLRGDFYGRALAHRALADRLAGHVENLSSMTHAELDDAIRLPAARHQVSFEPAVVTALLEAVQGRRGTLPLLQFALRELWRRRVGRSITYATYQTLGGVEQSLALRADAVFVAMTDDGRDAATARTFHRLFTRLVAFGGGPEDTRRVVSRGELPASAWALAQRLAGEDNRLVVTATSESSGDTVEIIHEALISHWPRLAGWVKVDRDFQPWLRTIRPSVELWQAKPDDDAPLLRGSLVVLAQTWLADRPDDISVGERAFIVASAALAASTADAKKRSRVLTPLVYAALAVALAAAAVGTYVAFRKTKEASDAKGAGAVAAENEAKVRKAAEAERLNRKIAELKLSQPDRVRERALLAIHSWQTYPTPEASQYLADASASLDHWAARFSVPGEDATLGRSGRHVVSWRQEDETLLVHRIDDDGPHLIWSAPTPGVWPNQLAVSADGRHAAMTTDHDVLIYGAPPGGGAADTGQLVPRPSPGPDGARPIWPRFSASGNYVVAQLPAENSLIAVPVQPQSATVSLPVGGNALTFDLSRRTDIVAVSATDGDDTSHVEVRSLASGAVVNSIPGEIAMHVAFGPDDDSIELSNERHRVSITGWRTARPHSEPHEDARFERAHVEAFDPSGAVLVAAESSRLVPTHHVSVMTRYFAGDLSEAVGAITDPRGIESIAFRESRHQVVTTRRDGLVTLWDDAFRSAPRRTMLPGTRAMDLAEGGARMVVTDKFFVGRDRPLTSDLGVSIIDDWKAPVPVLGPRRVLPDAATDGATAVSLDGTLIAVAYDDESGQNRTFAMFATDTGKQTRSVSVSTGHRDGQAGIRALAFGPAGSVVAVDGSGTVVVWNASSAKNEVATFTLALDASDRVTIGFGHHDGSLAIAWGSQVQTWREWTSQSPTKGQHVTVTDSDGKAVPIADLAISGDDRLLALATLGVGVKVWDLSEAVPRPLQVSTNKPNALSVAFHPSADVFAVADGDEVRVFAVNELQPWLRMPYPGKDVMFSRDGRYVLGHDGSAYAFWLWRPEDMIADACASLVLDELNEKEWAELVGTGDRTPACPQGIGSVAPAH